ncbi:family 16 glycoside hydrolase [Thalassoglobus polymorphus]|uniref:Cytochrome c n=1 Tax=Thalassoglobus polymorphus TaxID=2527994 RepID=A0A517QR23_9PLAN|nr:family 16 glycoside hydrolase [Thalassoglobus polymorphus]QDT34080.1 Cytochrome c [Thalassoglobus polymorphus]
MKLFVSLFLVLGLAIPSFAEDGYESLFNGKDLSGWDGNPELWSVEDGLITGKTNGPDHLKYNQFLIWKGGKVGDFELKLDFRVEGNNNSGVQYRSKELPNVGKWSVGGYQADIHGKPEYTGMLYDEQGRGIVAQRGQKVVVDNNGKKNATKLDVPVTPIDITKWHELTIRCEGNRLIHKIDGVTTVEIIDDHEAEREMEGIIAFQVHRGPKMKAQFRNIRLKKLGKNATKVSAKPTPKESKTGSENAKPKWIWQNKGEQPAKQVFFRKEFEVKGSVAAARLYATCDDQMTIFLDGTKVAEGGAWNRPVFADVTKLIEKKTPGGKHVLTVEGKNGASSAGLVASLNFESKKRDAWSIVTDESWQTATKPAKGWRNLGFKTPKHWKNADVVGQIGGAPWNITLETLLAAAPLREPEATPEDQLIVAKGFKTELLYSVPKDEEGSWVSMCTDPKGRLIVCDQYGGLFRVTPPGINKATELVIEPINVDIGEAQGLLWAFDSLYVVVNKGKKYESGVYRVKDTNNDDQLDSLETLRQWEGGSGEHGPHAVLLTPDKKGLYIVVGNKTALTEFASSRVPEIWDEDNMLPRAYGKGFMKGTPAPGGYISRIDPEGKEWELVTAGFRNEYDAALNADGELFTYDADMEWDLNTPWYRPTRICHVLSGVDYGWRNGGGKFPEHFADTLPPVVNIGPGSPTGVTFGYGAKFPAKYQKALFICDWSYGKMYAVHITPDGSTYTAGIEEFITGTPLPLTDLVINPVDGAMYFAIGGRRVQSGLYKVTYTGEESTAPVDATNSAGKELRAIRKKLEDLHVGDHPDAVEKAWPYLSHEDRVIRYAARTAIEHRPVSEWKEKALNETNNVALLEALLALARTHERATKNPVEAFDTPVPNWNDPAPITDKEASATQIQAFEALGRIDADSLTAQQKLHALRVVQLLLLRFGPPELELRDALVEELSPALPSDGQEFNSLLLDILIYLQDPAAARKGVALLENAPSQEEQINYAKSLRHLQAGWTPELRDTYFNWFVRASGYRGGASFGLFVSNIKEEALTHLSEEEIARLKPILDKKPEGQVNPFTAAPRPHVQDWTLDDLLSSVENDLTGRNFDHGRKMFGAANCFSCHRFAGEGGALGPDLTGLAGRFDRKYILESIIDPNKVISDQYAAVQILTVDGKVIHGRIVNLSGDAFRINTNMLTPDALVIVDRKQIEEMVPSKTSMMPKGSINTLTKEEILDLMAFLLSRGDRESPYFK